MIDRSVITGEAKPFIQRGLSVPVVAVHRAYTPAAVGAGETKALYRVRKGERVTVASLQILRKADAGSTATWTVGDSATNNGDIASTSADQAVGTLVDGKGTYVTQNGKLYGAVDTVNIYYTPGAGPGATAPTCDVRLVVQQEWPEIT